MSPRPYTLAPSLDVSGAAPSRVPAAIASLKADDGMVATSSPEPAATSPKGMDDATPAQGATDIVASCKDESALDASNAGGMVPPASKEVTTLPAAVQATIDRCIAVRDRPGSFIGWGERSEETAAASLDLVALMMKNGDALRSVRQKVNEDRKSRDERALNSSTSKELLAVYLCAPPKTKAERQECSRFANVIVVARKENRTSGDVGDWLRATTLTEVLEKARWLKNKPSNKTYSIAITRNKYPRLWQDFQTQKVRDAVAKALANVDNSLKKGAPNAR